MTVINSLVLGGKTKQKARVGEGVSQRTCGGAANYHKWERP